MKKLKTRVWPICTSDIGNIGAKLNIEECWEKINVKNCIAT